MTCTCRHRHAHSIKYISEQEWQVTCSCCDWTEMQPTVHEALSAGRRHRRDPGGQLLDASVRP